MSERRVATVELPLLPLRDMIVFPQMVTALEVGRERSQKAVEVAMLQDAHHVVLAAQKDAQASEPEPDDIYDIGTLAEIRQLLKLPDNHARVLVFGVSRVSLQAFRQEEPYYVVAAKPIVEKQEYDAEMEALMRTALQQADKYFTIGKKDGQDILSTIQEISDPSALADAIAAQLTVPVQEKQALLEIVEPRQRLEHLCVILGREAEILELEKRIQWRVRKQMEKAQREYYLREQIKAIQKELGEPDERAAEIEEIHRQIKAAKLPQQAEEKALHELDRLKLMPPQAAEAVVVRTYLDWIVSLPWTNKTKDRVDIEAAETILAEDHYGLSNVKERILEFLAVRQLATKIRGPILCLVGPPGVGKTSLAKSVANALGRKFYRFSLGGVRDEAEIRGHRRTYVGAMPGKIIQAMRAVGTRNPLILLDEIDKMSSDFRGDPSAALLEVLDPEQNHSFTDHYLEIPFDMSDAMFITTANVAHVIPGPLRDRMELIQIPGYTAEEKVEIAKRHLIPKQIELHGLQPEQLVIGEGAVNSIINDYTREAGVRNLERTVAAICRKAAREIVSTQKKKVRITKRALPRYLGQPRFRHAVMSKEDRIGVATGLAYTEVGGEILSIEVTVVHGKGKLILTGKLGEVMRESAQAAFSYIRTRAESLGIDVDFNEHYDIHIHVPEGAVPKDGPSAGITIATALASALSGSAVRRDWAMTGEITLRGHILPVGGVKEKVLAAHRAEISNVILPAENEGDLEDIPASVSRRMNFHFVDHMDRVIELVLLPLAQMSDRYYPTSETAATQWGESSA